MNDKHDLTVPLFSVIVPIYNKRSYLQKLSESLSKQTFRNFEVIFVDDGSTDDSITLVRSWTDPRYILIAQKNAGVSSARNTGIRAARGEFIAFLDADDWYEPDFLSEIWHLTTQFPQAGMYGTAFNMIKGLERKYSHIPSEIGIKSHSIIHDFYGAWSNGAFLSSSSVALRASEQKKHDLFFLEGENHGEDQEMWFSFAERTSVAYSRRYMSNYLLQVQNSLSSSSKYVEQLPVITRLIDRVKNNDIGLGNIRSARRVINKNKLENAANCARYGEKSRAVSLLLPQIFIYDFILLKIIVIAAIVTPTPVIKLMTYLKRKLRSNET